MNAILRQQSEGTVNLRLQLKLIGSMLNMKYALRSKSLTTVTHTFMKMAELVHELNA